MAGVGACKASLRLAVIICLFGAVPTRDAHAQPVTAPSKAQYAFKQLLFVQVTFFMGVALQKGLFKSLKNSLFRYNSVDCNALAYRPS